MSEIELKACPFCGGVPSGVHDYFDGRGDFRYVVNCTNDDCPTDYLIVGEDATAESAASKWNTRAPQWQPIATAPKDLSTFLAGEFYFAGGECTYKEFSTAYRHQDGQVHCYDGNVSPTHWQPLPDHPETE